MKFSFRTLLVCVALGSGVLFVASRFLYQSVPAPLDVYGSQGTYVYGMSDTHEFQAELKTKQISSLPKWDRRNPNPPLSANDAMVAAQSYRDQVVAAKQFPVGSIIGEAQLTPLDPPNGIWFWNVRFRVVQLGSPREEIEIAVLMDGSVVPHSVHRRTDTGWPPPDQVVPPHNSSLTDDRIVDEFIKNLNVDRKYAGQIVKLTGTPENIPDGHYYGSTGLYSQFESSDGHTLIVWFRGNAPSKGFKGEIRITGQLPGFRDRNDKSESWDDLTLFPGIRATSWGN